MINGNPLPRAINIGSYHYEREEEVMTGGCNEVRRYACKDSSGKSRYICLKMPREGEEINCEEIKEEARLLKEIYPEHEGEINLCPDSKNPTALTMPYFEGDALDRYLFDSIEEVLLVNRKVAEELKRRFHDKGIMHGDIKPENIIIRRNESGEIIIRFVDMGRTQKIGAPDIGISNSVFYLAPEYWQPYLDPAPLVRGRIGTEKGQIRRGVIHATDEYFLSSSTPQGRVAAGTATSAKDIFSLGVVGTTLVDLFSLREDIGGFSNKVFFCERACEVFLTAQYLHPEKRPSLETYIERLEKLERSIKENKKERLEGYRDLKEVLANMHSPEEIFEMYFDLCDWLNHFHQKGFAHLTLSDENILLKNKKIFSDLWDARAFGMEDRGQSEPDAKYKAYADRRKLDSKSFEFIAYQEYDIYILRDIFAKKLLDLPCFNNNPKTKSSVLMLTSALSCFVSRLLQSLDKSKKWEMRACLLYVKNHLNSGNLVDFFKIADFIVAQQDDKAMKNLWDVMMILSCEAYESGLYDFCPSYTGDYLVCKNRECNDITSLRDALYDYYPTLESEASFFKHGSGSEIRCGVKKVACQ
jgi:serine/threonine protein kinase